MAAKKYKKDCKGRCHVASGKNAGRFAKKSACKGKVKAKRCKSR